MSLFDVLTDDNFSLFAARNYQNRRCLSVDEFYEDLARFKYLKRLLRRYRDGGELQERLILNHIIILHNVFGIEAGKRMIFFRMEADLHPILKTFMTYLNYLRTDEFNEIPLDDRAVRALREL